MSDDFFAEIDRDIKRKKEGKEKEGKEKEKIKVNDTKIYFQNEISKLKEKINYYIVNCNKRGILATWHINNGSSFEFKIDNRKGYYIELIFSEGSGGNDYIFKENNINDDGKAFTSTCGESYNENNWSQEIATKKIEKTIKDFMFYVDRHGGL